MKSTYTVTLDAGFKPNAMAKEPSIAKVNIHVNGKHEFMAYLYPCGGWWIVQATDHANPIIPRKRGEGNTWNTNAKSLPKFIEGHMSRYADEAVPECILHDIAA